MDADKFTKFMETVEAVTGTVEMQNEAVVSADEKMEPVEMGKLPFVFEDAKPEEELSETEIGTAMDDLLDDVEDDDVEDEDFEDDDLEDEDEDEEDDGDFFEGDDDIAPIETITPQSDTSPTPSASSPAQPEPQDLLTGGLRFLSGLAQTLSSPEATERLVSSIVERDEKTGRSFMKIPVDDQQTVVNVMNMLGQLFKGFGK